MEIGLGKGEGLMLLVLVVVMMMTTSNLLLRRGFGSLAPLFDFEFGDLCVFHRLLLSGHFGFSSVSRRFLGVLPADFLSRHDRDGECRRE